MAKAYSYNPENWYQDVSNDVTNALNVGTQARTTQPQTFTPTYNPLSPDFSYNPATVPDYSQQSNADLANISRYLGQTSESDFYATDVGTAENAAGRGLAGSSAAIGALRRDAFETSRAKLGHEMLEPYLNRQQQVNLANISAKAAMDQMKAKYGADINLSNLNASNTLNQLNAKFGQDLALSVLNASMVFKEQAAKYGFDTALKNLDNSAALQRQIMAEASALQRDTQQQRAAKDLQTDRIASETKMFNTSEQNKINLGNKQLDSQVQGFVNSILGKYNSGAYTGSQSGSGSFFPSSQNSGGGTSWQNPTGGNQAAMNLYNLSEGGSGFSEGEFYPE